MSMKAANPEKWAAERIIEMLENGAEIPPWRKPWSIDNIPRNGVTGHSYKGMNLWMLLMAPYSNPKYYTINQLQKIGAYVKKGEKSWPVYFWSFFEDKNNPGKGRPFCKGYRVFNAAQIDWPEGKEPVCETANNDNNPIPVCEEIVAGYKDCPKLTEANLAAYSPSLDEIMMPNMRTFGKAEEYYSTLFHEMGHSTGHKSRLSRDGIVKVGNFGSHDYSQEELIAEFTAAMLCGHAGIAPNTIDNSAAYIKNWLKKLKDEPDMLVFASRLAGRAYNHIIGKNFEKEDSDE